LNKKQYCPAETSPPKPGNYNKHGDYDSHNKHSEGETMEESLKIIASLYLPVTGNSLVLPNVSIAEIVDYKKPESVADTPEWFLGKIQWRGVTLPVISYELINEKPLPESPENTRLAVINTIGSKHTELPFFAIVTQGIPSQTKVDKDNIKEIEKDEEKGPAELLTVNIQGDKATIPNVEYIEEMILKNQ
jgi:chemosensory pili system protein ChpC